MRCQPHLVFVALAGLQFIATPVRAQPGTNTLHFDAPMAAAISARYWDQTQAQWMTDADRANPLFFDAVHRFLLLRFPGAAEAIHARLQAGQEVASAALVMRWTGQEFMREPGYVHRSWPLEGKPEPDWHARVWLLRRPWVDDPEIGPTWNSYLNGLGFWRGGGARDESDRFPEPLAEVLLSDDQPLGEADVTAALTSDEFGSIGERLRRIADCGFMVNKAELLNQEYGEMAGALGLCRIFIAEPALVVRFRPGEARMTELPPAQDARALAERLRAEGPDGEPTSRIPENLDQLLAEYRARHQDLPSPEGAIIRAEGQFGCGRILVRPSESLLQVDHYLPAPGGELGAVRLQDDAAAGPHAGPAEWEEPLLRFVRPGFDVRTAREQTGRALLVTGMSEPLRVVLNGEALTGELARVEADGRAWLRVPIAPED